VTKALKKVVFKKGPALSEPWKSSRHMHLDWLCRLEGKATFRFNTRSQRSFRDRWNLGDPTIVCPLDFNPREDGIERSRLPARRRSRGAASSVSRARAYR
jgi:hypothetical protein